MGDDAVNGGTEIGLALMGKAGEGAEEASGVAYSALGGPVLGASRCGHDEQRGAPASPDELFRLAPGVRRDTEAGAYGRASLDQLIGGNRGGLEELVPRELIGDRVRHGRNELTECGVPGVFPVMALVGTTTTGGRCRRICICM